MRLQLERGWKCVGRLQVHGICNRRLVHREVAEDRLNYKRTYLWWFRNPACGDSILGLARLKKTSFVCLLGLFGERGSRSWCDLLCGASLDDWANGGVDILKAPSKVLVSESPLKKMKNAFYFTLKTLFFLKIFKLLSWSFGYAGKWLDYKDQVNFKIYDVTTWLTNSCNAHIY